MSNDNFGFPYEPYDIQKDFMKALYDVLSESKIGIFESPTGTGKSLSLICGSLQWLTDHADQLLDTTTEMTTCTTTSQKDDDNEPDWLRSFVVEDKKQHQHQRQLEKKQDLQRRIDHVRLYEKTASLYQRKTELDNSFIQKKFKKSKSSNSSDDNDDKYLLDDYDSEDDEFGGSRNGQRRKTFPVGSSNSNLSKEVLNLLASLNEKSLDASEQKELANGLNGANDEDDFEQRKIFYASRTHSQLSQFIHEIGKTKYAEHIWIVALGSRKNLCINEKVRSLGGVHRINEACLDLQKKGTESERCSYLPLMKEKGQWQSFQEHALAQVQDIEDLCKKGKELHICPYYGTRQTTKPAQLVVLPYQHLLHANTRESLGISLKGNIIIIDEAHNLMETISSIHTVTISLSQLLLALSQIRMYIEKYLSRLLGKNTIYIKQMITILKAFVKVLESKDKKDTVLTVNDFVHLTGIDHFNLFKLQKYLESSQLAKKLNGFYDKVREQQQELYQKQLVSNPKAILPPLLAQKTSSSSIPTLHQVESFMMCLTHPDNDGRIVITFGTSGNDSSSTEPQIKYMLLNPADVFKPIVDEARSIILAGGTMEPVSDFTRGLFPSIPVDKIHHFSCGHIIPSDNLLTMTIDQGPTGKSMLFNYANREDTQLIDEVGRCLVNLCNVVPDGLVCFFASFTYLDTVYRRWNTVESGNILERLNKKKKVFKEPRESNKVDSTLRDYSLHIESQTARNQTTGAILLSVVNGKMSEGINFSDRLGRCVVMVGLPFPNRFSVELNEKIKYADSHVPSNGEKSNNMGQEYYENLCMRGVNQSIGRAIRHKGDYASIVLLDKRYASPRISKKLPGWIGGSIEHCDNFGKAMGKTARFFNEKKKSTIV
ncbi:putative ATP-dependent RNA helicase DDX11 [Halteromyces radiatus]|uniref:putative ATP-dependent RNA helicase DDX11 n=1 Tax=Halteromyces radiatus TaxID=101107 RepID=UPI002221230B|nr:putative ATP-dependent RNA helicase DDX11 [Halteromyces radiatus]KAI8089909.1 putative ATP-dependent RNA helicase DDX11 [Halteromyces radiatus]